MRGPSGSLPAASLVGAAGGTAGPLRALTDLQQTLPLVYAMLIISIIGAAVTWGFLVYALWKFRDPATKGRKYG